MRLLILFALVVVLAGCSGPQRIEVQNRGEDDVVVTLSFAKETRQVSVPAGRAEIEGLWDGASPEKLTVEAKWGETVRRQTYARSALPTSLAKDTSAGGIQGLAVSPEGFAWVQSTLWTRLQNPALIPFVVLAIGFGVRYMLRARNRKG